MTDYVHEFPGIFDGVADRRDAELHFSLICAVAEEIDQVPLGLQPVEVDEAAAVADHPAISELLEFNQNFLDQGSFVHYAPGGSQRAETWSSAGDSWEGKPVHALYTCPGDTDWPGGWHLLSRMFPSIYPTGRTAVYAATGPYRSRVISSAGEWCDFILTHPTPDSDGAIGVDWNLVRSNYECVTICAPAILGCDHMPLARGEARFKPVAWTVPTTIWLAPECLSVVEDM